jgi:hypothetical protein
MWKTGGGRGRKGGRVVEGQKGVGGGREWKGGTAEGVG